MLKQSVETQIPPFPLSSMSLLCSRWCHC